MYRIIPYSILLLHKKHLAIHPKGTSRMTHFTQNMLLNSYFKRGFMLINTIVVKNIKKIWWKNIEN